MMIMNMLMKIAIDDDDDFNNDSSSYDDENDADIWLWFLIAVILTLHPYNTQHNSAFNSSPVASVFRTISLPARSMK